MIFTDYIRTKRSESVKNMHEISLIASTCMVRACSYFVVKVFYYGPYCILIVVDSIDMESCVLLQYYVADNISIYGQKVIEHSKKIDATRRRPVWIYISASFLAVRYSLVVE